MTPASTPTPAPGLEPPADGAQKEKSPLARKASRAQALLKVMAWGEPGSGKTRFALSFPAPLVIDLERGSEWYGDEFDFLVAMPSPSLKAGPLVHAVVEEVLAGAYPDRKTLVIDPITDYLDSLESALIEGQRKRGIDLDMLKGPKRAQFYAAIRDGIRARMDALLRVPMHVVLVARAKNVWGKNDEGQMAPIDRTYDAKDIAEYLCDIVLHLEHGRTRVGKARGSRLPDTLEAPSYAVLAEAVQKPAPPIWESAAEDLRKAKDEKAVTRLLKAAEENPALMPHLSVLRGIGAEKLAELSRKPKGNPPDDR